MWNNDWNNWGWGAWCLMFGIMVVIVGLGFWVVANLVRSDTPTTGPGRSAEDVLAERFARGKLSEDDYVHQRDLIRGGRETTSRTT